jgi:HD-like signal output (HDOD) protein
MYYMRVCVCVVYQRGETPLKKATNQNHTVVAEVLRKAGGREDQDRCFSTLVLGGFQKVVFITVFMLVLAYFALTCTSDGVWWK